MSISDKYIAVLVILGLIIGLESGYIINQRNTAQLLDEMKTEFSSLMEDQNEQIQELGTALSVLETELDEQKKELSSDFSELETEFLETQAQMRLH